MLLPKETSDAFHAGVLTRLDGLNKYFNPYKEKNDELYIAWLKGWTDQNNLIMTKR